MNEPRPVLDVAVEPRAVAGPEHHREEVHVGGVLVGERRDRKGDPDQRLLEVAPHDGGPHLGLERLRLARVGELRARSGARERLADLPENRLGVEVAHRDEGLVVWHVPAAVEVGQLLAREARDVGLRADHAAPVGVPGPDDQHERIERVAEHVDPRCDVPACHREVVDGHVEAGKGVDVPARRFDGPRDLAHLAALGSLEQHVLEDVRHAPLRLELVRASRAHPQVQRHDGRRVILEQEDVEAVV